MLASSLVTEMSSRNFSSRIYEIDSIEIALFLFPRFFNQQPNFWPAEKLWNSVQLSSILPSFTFFLTFEPKMVEILATLSLYSKKYLATSYQP